MFRYFAFAICLYLAIAVTAAAQTPLAIVAPWALASVGQAKDAAVYLTIVSSISDRLTGAAAPVARAAELHMMSMDGEMRSIETIALTAGWPVSLRPGGLHIMLLGLAQPLLEGQSFPLTLFFETSGRHEVTVGVQKPTALMLGGSSPAQTTMPTHHH